MRHRPPLNRLPPAKREDEKRFGGSLVRLRRDRSWFSTSNPRRRERDKAVGLPSKMRELGVPCKAVIVQTQPLGMRDPNGDDMYAFALTILAEGRPPYQIEVGNPVPAAALPLLYPGNTVPAKRIPDGDDRELVIDWEGALAQLTTTAA
jgi:hypothetical protein